MVARDPKDAFIQIENKNIHANVDTYSTVRGAWRAACRQPGAA
jgi:hypothetical protein